ncbi:MAG: dicarboxylate/amino acid:cation symporter [Bacteroidetes bacterium]|nr:MAG: dicarboxylate/amino acid:cation symporter [Bacteroidota bacterium]
MFSKNFHSIFLKSGIFIWIIIAIILGVCAGFLLPDLAQNTQLLSDIFLRLIKMIMAPLVFSTIVIGIAKLGDFKTVGRIGIKTLIYFYAATCVSLLLGLLLVNYFEPGKAMDLSLSTAQNLNTVQSQSIDFKSFIYRIFPTSIFEAMSKNEILPIVIFSLFFGTGLAAIGEKGKPVYVLLESVAEIMFKITSYVMKFAPFAVFGALATVVGKQGIGVLKGYGFLIACFYGGLLFFGFVILPFVCAIFKINFLKLFSNIKEPVLLAYSTATSESAYPKTLEGLDKFGCNPKISGFVLPLGYSFNLDGSMMYMTFATLFIAQSYGIEISISQQFSMMLVLLVASKGVAGVPRASLVVISGLLDTFQIPAEGLVLLLGIDHILDMGRSAINVMGNAVAACVVDKWEVSSLRR